MTSGHTFLLGLAAGMVLDRLLAWMIGRCDKWLARMEERMEEIR